MRKSVTILALLIVLFMQPARALGPLAISRDAVSATFGTMCTKRNIFAGTIVASGLLAYKITTAIKNGLDNDNKSLWGVLCKAVYNNRDYAKKVAVAYIKRFFPKIYAPGRKKHHSCESKSVKKSTNDASSNPGLRPARCGKSQVENQPVTEGKSLENKGGVPGGSRETEASATDSASINEIVPPQALDSIDPQNVRVVHRSDGPGGALVVWRASNDDDSVPKDETPQELNMSKKEIMGLLEDDNVVAATIVWIEDGTLHARSKGKRIGKVLSMDEGALTAYKVSEFTERSIKKSRVIVLMGEHTDHETDGSGYTVESTMEQRIMKERTIKENEHFDANELELELRKEHHIPLVLVQCEPIIQPYTYGETVTRAASSVAAWMSHTLWW